MLLMFFPVFAVPESSRAPGTLPGPNRHRSACEDFRPASNIPRHQTQGLSTVSLLMILSRHHGRHYRSVPPPPPLPPSSPYSSSLLLPLTLLHLLFPLLPLLVFRPPPLTLRLPPHAAEWFPDATWVFSQLPKCHEAIPHGNKLYILFIKLFARNKCGLPERA